MAYLGTFLASEKNLKKTGLVDRNIDGNILLTAMQYTQDEIVKNCIGKCLFAKLISLIATGEIDLPENAKYKYLLDEFIFNIMLYGVMAYIQVPLSLKTRNKGNISTGGEYISNSSYGNIRYVQNEYQNRADKYNIELSRYLCENYSDYPELNCGCCNYGWKRKAYNSPIFVRSRKRCCR